MRKLGINLLYPSSSSNLFTLYIIIFTTEGCSRRPSPSSFCPSPSSCRLSPCCTLPSPCLSSPSSCRQPSSCCQPLSCRPSLLLCRPTPLAFLPPFSSSPLLLPPPPSSSPATLVAAAIARLIVVLLSSPLGSTLSLSLPFRPREPTDHFDVVVAGSSYHRHCRHAVDPPPVA